MWWVRAKLVQAIARGEVFLARLASWPFSFSSKKKSAQNRKIGIFNTPFFFLILLAFSLYFRFSLWGMILFLVIITNFCPKNQKRLELKMLYTKKIQLGFSSKIEVPSSARFGNFYARLGSAREISAQTHH